MKSITIAQEPMSPRDHSRLFVYNTKTNQIFFDRFYNIDKYLPDKSFLVFNNTKVVPARIKLRKKNGGIVKVLFLVNEFNGACQDLFSSRRTSGRCREPLRSCHPLNIIRGMVDRKINIEDKLFFDSKHSVTTVRQDKNIFTFKLNFPREKLFELLEKNGTMPIPPYIKNTPLTEDELRKKYQTVFAGTPVGARFLGSTAAPTASLHFTDRVFKKLEKKGFKKYFITLHVGLGTFALVTEENFKSKKLHQEYFEVDEKTLQCFERSKREGKKLVAVGTTVTRALEALAKSKIKNQKSKFFGETDLFIFPPYEFKMVDCLITNFHLPGSSLRMLVEAFLQFKKAKKNLIDLYNVAIRKDFRFYSFGDGMLIL